LVALRIAESDHSRGIAAVVAAVILRYLGGCRDDEAFDGYDARSATKKKPTP
jgi:hypothetical protein